MTVQTPLSLDDYDAIASAVMETERGRWFLAEFARRNRATDTAAVLAALGDLERALANGRPLEAQSRTPDSDNERAAHLVRRIAERASLIRNELHRSADPQARITRAHAHLDKLERLIALALSAAGAPPRAAIEPKVRYSAPALPAPADAEGAETTDAAFIDAPFEAAPWPPSDVGALGNPPQDADASELHPAPSRELAVFVNGHAIDILASEDEAQTAEPDAASGEINDCDPTPVFRSAPEAELAEAQIVSETAPSVEPEAKDKPVKMPPAEAPLLLDSLSAETKAILFA